MMRSRTDPTPCYFSSAIEPQDCNLKCCSVPILGPVSARRPGREGHRVGRRIETALVLLFFLHSAADASRQARAVSAFTAFRINLRDLLPWRSIATKSPT
jgi:hypothetical protein